MWGITNKQPNKLKVTRKKDTFKRKTVRLIADFSNDVIEAKKQWNYIVKVLKGKIAN